MAPDNSRPPDRDFIRTVRDRLRQATRDWWYPVFLLGRRAFIAIAGIFVVAVLPFHAFISEGPHAHRVRDSAATLSEALVDSAAARPWLAIAALAALIVTGWQFFRNYVSRHKMREVLEILNDYMAFHKRKFETDIVSPLQSHPTLSEDKYELLVEHINELLWKLCTRVSSTFDKLTNADCCATIKIFDFKTQKISTRTRDLEQDSHRTRADDNLPWFIYTDNTAFKSIVDDNKEFYHSNWLPIWWLIGVYRNKNQEWIKYYSATIVIPIKIQKNGAEQTIGFLCVDNHKGRFPSELSKVILESYRSAVCDLLVVLGRVRKKEDDDGRGGKENIGGEVQGDR